MSQTLIIRHYQMSKRFILLKGSGNIIVYVYIHIVYVIMYKETIVIMVHVGIYIYWKQNKQKH